MGDACMVAGAPDWRATRACHLFMPPVRQTPTQLLPTRPGSLFQIERIEIRALILPVIGFDGREK
jgi:hypothetical protein